MNWDAIGTVADIVGAIAVVVSLLYLAVQVRQNAAVSRSSAFRAIFDGLTAHNNFMFGPQNVELMIRCLRDYPGVPAEDRMRFDNLMTNLLNYLEASFEAAEAQTLGSETMDNWAWWFQTKILPYPGPRAWWSQAKPTYPDYVQDWVDKCIDGLSADTDYWGLSRTALHQRD